MGESKLAGQFFDAAIGLLQQVRDGDSEEIAAASTPRSPKPSRTATGSSPSARATPRSPPRTSSTGPHGLALMNLLAVPGVVGVDVMPATLGSALERVDGLAGAVLDSSPAKAGDVLIIISLSGRNALPVEMAMNARALGLTVIGVTSVAYATETKSRHVSGSYLKDHCDIVLDSRIAIGDAELTHEGIEAPFAPASTVVTSALMQATMAAAAEELVRRGIEPPLLRSGNVDGGHEWNGRVMTEYGDRIFFRH